MVHINNQQNNFSAGVIQNDYIGRADLNLYANGLKAMHNMDILPSGALQKRQGTENIKRIRSDNINEAFQARLETFTSYDGRNFILVFQASNLQIFELLQDQVIWRGSNRSVIPANRQLNGTTTQWEANPKTQTVFWDNYNINEMKIAKGENYFMICHKNHQPVLLVYSPDAQIDAETGNPTPPFIMRHWITHMDTNGIYKMPYSRFEMKPSVQLKLSFATHAAYDYLSSDTPIFDNSWIGAAIRISDNQGKEVEITGIVSATKVRCKIVGVTGSASINGEFTASWSEAIFSKARGWPSVAAFHQGRLIFGASPSFPKTIWMSKSGDYHDFTLGENSDAAIDITLASPEAGEIRNFLSAKHLQIFTSSSEWVISDEVITPSDITLQKRTNIGIHKNAAPILLNGSSLFFDNQNNLHEYTYASLEDNYVVNNLSRLNPNQAGSVLNMNYDPESRRLFCPWNNEADNNDGMKILNLYQAEKITAWTEYKTAGGDFIDIISLKGKIFALSKRYFEHSGTSYFSCYLEKFSKNAKRDCLTFIDTDHFIEAAHEYENKFTLDTNTKELKSYNLGSLTYNTSLVTGRFRINQYLLSYRLRQLGIYSAVDLFTGLSIEAYIESLPPILINRETHSRYRLLEAIFHIGDGQEFAIDTGFGFKNFNQDNASFLGESNNTDIDIVRSLKITGGGWSNNLEDKIWKINFTNRSNFTLYGVEMRLSIH